MSKVNHRIAPFVLFLISAFLALPATNCAHFPPPGPVVSCLEELGESAVKDVATRIFTIIDNGVSLDQTEAQILAVLTSEAISVAPGVWRCAMQFVSNPDNPKSSNLKSLGPNVATRATAAAIAADYLHQHPSP